MAYFEITIEDTGETYRQSEKQNILQGMAALGRKGIPLGCCGGGCGVCKIEILEGSYSKRVMSREHVSSDDEKKGCVLACRIWPTSNLRLRVIGKMSKNLRLSRAA